MIDESLFILQHTLKINPMVTTMEPNDYNLLAQGSLSNHHGSTNQKVYI